MPQDPPHRRHPAIHWGGLVAGPGLALVAWAILPDTYSDATGETVPFGSAGRATLAIMAWMAAWWLTEAIDISATALLPLVLFPLTGIASMSQAAAPYADKLIFLFMGGFILALAMQRWGLDRRIALITLRLVGTRPRNMVGGIMLATGVLSMFVSNTATAAMMLPIALSVLALMAIDADAKEDAGPGSLNFGLCMLLGIAYAATIGGIATKIGTPPNGLLLGFIERTDGRSIGFFEWLGVGLPLVAVFGPVTWIVLTRVVYPVPREPIAGVEELIASAHRGLGAVKPGEWATFVVFMITASLWMLRPIIANGITRTAPPGEAPIVVVGALVPGLTDAGIAIGAALALFVIPVQRRPVRSVMDWATAEKMPWGILVLFGGGLSLADAVERNGVAEFLGHLAAAMGGLPTIVIVVAVIAAVIFLTELTSNTATTATLLPVLAGLAPGLGVHPYLLIIPAALAASCAFMMPVATPPNAIVFGSGHLTIARMCRAGIWLNLIGIVLITALMYGVVIHVLDIGP